MKKSKNRILSFLLALLMVISTVMGHVDYAFAAEGSTETVYKEVTNVSEIATGGNFVLVGEMNGKYSALGTTIATKITSVDVTINGDEVSADSLPVWTISPVEVEGVDNTVSLYNGSKYLGYNSGTDFKTDESAYAWAVAADETKGGGFSFVSAVTTRGVACNSSNKFGAYATSNMSSSSYDFVLRVFKETTEQVNENACAPVKASPKAGAVPVGTEVTLSCATENATIYYNLDGSENYSEYAGDSIVISEETTIQAYASNGILEDSAIATFNYTIAACAPVTASPVAGKVELGAKITLTTATTATGAAIYYSTNDTASKEDYTLYENPIEVSKDTTIYAYAKADNYVDGEVEEFAYTVRNTATPLATGDEIVIYCKGMLLTNVVSGAKLAGVTATELADDKLQVESNTVAFLAATYHEDGGYYTFTNNGKYLTSGATGSGVSFETESNEYSKWMIYEAATTGKYLIKSVNASYNNTPQYIEYYSGFTTYSLSSTAKETDYEVSFYPSSKVEVVKPVAKPTISPESGAVEKNTVVTITNNEEGATVYYTVDGSDPTTSNTRVEYTSDTEIVVTETMTIKAVAVRDGVYSDVVSKNYVITEEGNDGPAVITDTLKDGNVIVMHYPAANIVIGQAENKTGVTAVEGTPVDGTLTVPEGAVELTVSIDDNGYYSFITKDGKYLTTPQTGGTVTFANTASDYSLWTVEPCGSSFHIASVNAKYNNTSVQYMEYYNGGFKTYSFNASYEPAYDFTFYKVKEGTPTIKVDPSYTGTVAQWAGGMIAGGATLPDTMKELYGDKITADDKLDKNSVLTAVVSGKPVVVYTDPNHSSNNHYVGAKLAENDYIQLQTSSVGYGNMDLSFRLRPSKGAPAEYTVQYSVDGDIFYNFASGSYNAKYTTGYGETATEREYNGDITNGVCKFTSAVAEQYVTFTLDVPTGASNAETLYIRFVGGSARADGDNTKVVSGNLRIDAVKLTGNPIISKDTVGYVQASPASGEVLLGQEITLTSATEGAEIYYSFDGGNTTQKYDENQKPVFTNLPVNLEVRATKDGKNSITTLYQYTQAKCLNVKATPSGGAVAVGAQVTLRCNTEGSTIKYAFVTEGEDNLTWNEYTEPFALDTLPAEVKVQAVKEGYLDSEISTLTFAKRENDKYNIYFGQLHAHTNYSDGAGSVEDAFQHATQVDNLDFLAVTDHSNSFDEADQSVISKNMDTAETNEWTMGHKLAEQYSTDDFTCLYGYEMTWSNGLGHMNTFNTPGYQSRTQSAYTTYSTALQNYYSALKTVPDSLSMFNHPGTTFGDFTDFAYWSEEMDALITMIEVGNGEGAIGSSGYFPSYEYYTRALDKGWHVSPTNNQDNHKGLWGDANTARSVVLADNNTPELIYDAMRNNRMYATEDNNLSIYYTLDGYIMGTVLEEDQVSDNVNIVVELNDADASDKIGKVEVIANGGLSVGSKNVKTNAETVTFQIPANYSYYYIKVTQADGDIAVTSPVWVGEVEACGINKTYTNAVLAVENEAVDVNVEFFNNEAVELVIDSVEVTVNGEKVHTSTADTLAAAGVATIAPEGTGTYSFEHVYDGVGTVIYNVTVKATLNGVQKVYTDKLELSYTVAELVTKVIIDGSHYNDYVTGYYGDNVGEFISICADKNIRAIIDKDGITAEELADCALLVISAPAKKSATANAGAYEISHFEDSFIQLVKDYVANGGSVIVCGLADYQDTTDGQTATEQNKLLEAIGSTIRMNSDEAYDEVNNGGQAYRLYPENFDRDSKWLAGIRDGQTYSAYSGCTVNIENAIENEFVYPATALVRGFDTTYSIDCKDNAGNKVSGSPVYVEKGNAVFMASQETKAGGNIFVTGSVFLSNFEVKAEMDNPDSLPYANYTIVNNILADVEKQLEVSPISVARKGNLGDVFAVEGYVTAGTANENTTFFDSIYIQDETGGICVFPFSTAGLEIGTKMRITGYIEEYQGEREIQVMSYKILDEEKKVYDPREITTAQATDYDTFGGQLVKVTGIVTRVELTADGLGVAEYWVKDASGVEAAVFIDGYILSGTKGTNTLASIVKVGDTVSGCGVLYKHPEGDSDVSVPVLRVRDCDEIVRITTGGSSSGTTGGSSGGTTGESSSGTTVNITVKVEENKATVDTIKDEELAKVTATKEETNIEVDLTGFNKTIDTVVIPTETVKKIAQVVSDTTNKVEGLTVKLSTATVTLDAKALNAVVGQADGDNIQLDVDDVHTSRLNKVQLKAVEKLDVHKGVEAYFTCSGKRIGDFKGGEVTIELPFEVPAGYKPEGFSVWYVDDNGKTTKYKTTYKDGKLSFVVDHFSDFIVVYDGADAKQAETVEVNKTFRYLRLRGKETTKNSIKLVWNKVADADGYILYGNKCNANGKKYTIKKIKTIKDADVTKLVVKDLKKGTYYKYYIKAYKLVDGKKVILGQSKTIRATTTGGKYGNAKAVKVNKTKVTLKVGETFDIQAKQIKKDKPIAKYTTIKFESSKSTVAKVNKNGKVTAKKKGTATIYVYAQNGIYKTIKVTVK